VPEIYRERLPRHPLLGRHVHLDSRSRAYAVQPGTVAVRSVRHTAHIGILDQGQVGACTGFSATSCAYHEPYATLTSKPWKYAPTAAGALAWYHENTVEDGFAGTYLPDDTGSDGLTASKVAREAGISTGYQPALDLDSSLAALMTAPGITGIPWYQSMFDVDSSGLVTVDVRSGLAGGHELCVRGRDGRPAGQRHGPAARRRAELVGRRVGRGRALVPDRGRLVEAAEAGRRRLLLDACHTACPDAHPGSGRRRDAVGRDEELDRWQPHRRQRQRRPRGQGVGQGQGAGLSLDPLPAERAPPPPGGLTRIVLGVRAGVCARGRRVPVGQVRPGDVPAAVGQDAHDDVSGLSIPRASVTPPCPDAGVAPAQVNPLHPRTVHVF
jgi:hypothetical protein